MRLKYLLSSAAFLPAASHGLIEESDEWVLDTGTSGAEFTYMVDATNYILGGSPKPWKGREVKH